MKLVLLFVTMGVSLSQASIIQKSTMSVSELYIESLKDNYKPGVYDGVVEPKKLPDLEENRKSLLGIDSNRDGVRDDVEIYINRHFEQDYDREIYKKFFRRGTHYLITAKKMSLKEVQETFNGFDQDLECFRYLAKFGHLRNREERERRTFDPYRLLFDTDDRKNLFNEGFKKLSISGSGVGTGEEAFKFCPKAVQQKYPMKKKVK